MMTLVSALSLSQQPVPESATPVPVALLLGAQPLHLATFTQAHARRRFPETGARVETGTFDDLCGSVERAVRSGAPNVAIVVEWSDLDPRLGVRHLGGWSHALAPEIEGEVGVRISRLDAAMRAASPGTTIALAAPTLPWPPVGPVGGAQASSFELRVRARLAVWLSEIAEAGVRVVNDAELARLSPPATRFDVGLGLGAGCPYTVAHADALASMLIDALFPAPPLKGIITDLDETFWRGIVGEIGPDRVAWDLEGRAQLHGLYQQLLSALADRGVLIAVASKNDPAVVQAALARRDVLCPTAKLFPIEAGWGPKSASVDRILRAWHITARDVVFVDDSAMELAEVAAMFPEITCIRFDRGAPADVWSLLHRLRDLFGRPAITAEDGLRLQSLRAAAIDASPRPGSPDEFVAGLQGRVELDYTRDPAHDRALELINKTNQFNLNGRRWTAAEFRDWVNDPDRMLVVAAYEDRFGALGRIAVVAAGMSGDALHIGTWVMSCRAFSRRIEHHLLRHLVDRFQPSRIVLPYRRTDRNGPMREFLETFGDEPLDDAGDVVIAAGRVRERCPATPHAVFEVRHG